MAHIYFEDNDRVGGIQLSTWGGIFPILNLPCPPASRPEIVESQQGSVRFAWWEGDTNLYRIAIHSYPDSTLLFLSDTLTDSTFHLTDSLMAHIGLPEGRYYIRLQRACNYMDSPFDTLLWSPWSYARMFYYAPAPVGIDNPDLHAPLFSLSPNPATNPVTVECFAKCANATADMPLFASGNGSDAGSFSATIAAAGGLFIRRGAGPFIVGAADPFIAARRAARHWR